MKGRHVGDERLLPGQWTPLETIEDLPNTSDQNPEG